MRVAHRWYEPDAARGNREPELIAQYHTLGSWDMIDAPVTGEPLYIPEKRGVIFSGTIDHPTDECIGVLLTAAGSSPERVCMGCVECPTYVPEPAGALLLLAGMITLALLRRWRVEP